MSSLIAVILAAGTSSRLGSSKQLCVYRGSTLLARTLKSLEHPAIGKILVVTGWQRAACWAEVVSHAGAIPCEEVYNEDFAAGMGSSVAIAAKKVLQSEADCQALLLCVCDQIAMDGAVIARLIAASRPNIARPSDNCHALTSWRLTASTYSSGEGGTPALFPRSSFENLAQLTGDRGAKALLANAERVLFTDGQHDLDTPADLARFLIARQEI